MFDLPIGSIYMHLIYMHAGAAAVTVDAQGGERAPEVVEEYLKDCRLLRSGSSR